MFGCCCNSTTRKSAVIGAILTLAGAAGGVWLSNTLDTEPAAEPAKPAEVIPAGYQPEAEMTPEQMMEMMKAWGEPVEEHKVLADSAGNWDCETKFWMAPDAPPEVNHGTCQNEVILGGRYVTQHFVMPDFMGAEFQGMGAIGYDKQKGEYSNVWIDNFSTSMMVMSGQYDEETKTMTWVGTAASPLGETDMKHIVKTIDEDHTVMEFWESNAMTGGEFMKTGEITYTRRK